VPDDVPFARVAPPCGEPRERIDAMRLPATVLCLLLLSACDRDAAPAAVDAAAPPAATPSPEPLPPPPLLPSPQLVAPAFVNTRWRADTGSGVAVGTLYTFNGDGTLLIEAPGGTPAIGAWRFVDGALTMTEEGIDYATDIVSQDAEHVHLRSHNPGGVVELLLVRDTPATP
jgi:hypothetical protein